MKNTRDTFISGFSPGDTVKIETHLKRLLPHLKQEQFVIVGGLTIRYHLLRRGIAYPARPFNDLDIIVESWDTVRPSITKDFLVAHVHRHAGTWYLR